MKLLHDLSGSVCLLLTMVIVQVICLWTFEIEKEIIDLVYGNQYVIVLYRYCLGKTKS